MGSDAMDGVSVSNGLYFLLMVYRGCCLSHGKGGNFYSHAETQRAQSFIRTQIAQISQIYNSLSSRYWIYLSETLPISLLSYM